MNLSIAIAATTLATPGFTDTPFIAWADQCSPPVAESKALLRTDDARQFEGALEVLTHTALCLF